MQADRGEQGRALVFVRGRVQGVGFRWWTRARALELGLAGYARNLPDGRVEVVAQGPREDVERFVDLLGGDTAEHRRPGHVTGTTVHWQEPKDGVEGFSVL